MPAVAGEQIAAGRQRAVQIEVGNGPAGPLPALAIERDEHGRPARLLDEPGRDDADDPRVPAFLGEHDPVGGIEVRRIELAACLVQRRAVQFLAPAVQLLQIAGDPVSVRFILGREQLNALDPAIEAAHRVQAGRDGESHAAGRDRLAFETRRTHQSPQAGVLRLGQQPEAVADEDAILPAERRDIGDRRQRDEIEQREDRSGRSSQPGGERQRELEHDARGGQVLVGIPATVAFGIEHGEGARQRATGQVVVGDDDVDARGIQSIDRRMRIGATVGRDDQSRPRVARGGDARGAEIVPIGKAMGDKRDDASAESAQRSDQE